MYAEDSFYTLSTTGQAGLVALSLLLFAAIVFATHRLTRRRPAVLRIAAAIAAFWAFVWLSPQIYYLYYLAIFDGLPLQSVIHRPPSPLMIVRLIAFLGDATLSAHTQGALAWALVISALWPRKASNGGGAE